LSSLLSRRSLPHAAALLTAGALTACSSTEERGTAAGHPGADHLALQRLEQPAGR
jgi:hypothetical protein